MYSNISEVWGKDPVKEVTNKISSNNISYTPTNNSSISLNSDDYYKNIIKTPEKSTCEISLDHIQECDKCNNKLKKLIDHSVNRKINKIIDKKIQKKNKKYNFLSETQKDILLIIFFLIIIILFVKFIYK